MVDNNISFIVGKSTALLLSAICLNGIIIDNVYANSEPDLVPENLKIAQNINSSEIKVFCSKILKPQDIKKIVPELIIETEVLKLEANSTEIPATCPQVERVLIIKLAETNNLTTNREAIKDGIRQFYIEEGYINSLAILYGSRDILVEEGRVEVVVEAREKLQKYVRDRIEPAANPFNTKKIEDRLRLLQSDPLIENIEATIKPNEETNTPELLINVTAANSLFGNIGVDNYSPPSIGSERLNLNLGYRNLTGIGDTFAIAYSPRLETFDGTYNLGFNYQAPLNSMNGTLNLEVKIDRNEIINGEFKSFDIRGESETYGISYRQPLVLTPREELALSVGFTYRDGQNFLFQNGFPFGQGPDEDGVSRTSVLNLGKEYTRRDPVGAWGFRSQFRVGLDIFDATDNEVPDANGDYIPDGQFFSWLAQIQRIQVLNSNNFLIIQGDLQLTPHSLLPSEQFVVGGGQSVRGYRQNARSGDNGIRFSLEDRITIAKNEAEEPIFVVAPFFNMGAVWNVENNPNKVPNKNFLAALGLGLLWQPAEGLNLRLDYAPPLIDLEDETEYNIQDDGLHFSVNYSF